MAAWQAEACQAWAVRAAARAPVPCPRCGCTVKHGQSILYTSAEIIDCILQRGGGPLRCLYKFEEPQLLHGNGALPQVPRGLGAIDDQGFVRRQRNQCAL